MKLVFALLIASQWVMNLAYADINELFRQKAAIEAQQNAERQRAQNEKYDRETNQDLNNIMGSFAGKHRGLGSQPTYEYCARCNNTSLVNSIGFTTNDGYECQADRLDIGTTFNGEIHHSLACIQKGSLKTIRLIKVGGRWRSYGR